MRRKIVIVSEGFPYWPKENFLHGEIECLHNEFDLNLLPLVLPKGAALQELPANVKVLTPVLKRNYFLRLMQGVFNTAPVVPFLKDFKNIFKEKKGTVKQNFINWASTTVNSRALLASAQIQNLKKEPNTAIYLYWCNYPVDLFKNFPNRIFSRVHGTEFATVSSDYISMYGEKLSTADNVLYIPISNQAAEIISVTKPVKFAINRLGVFENTSQDQMGLEPSKKIRIVSVAYLIGKKRISLIAEALMYIKDVEVEWIHFGDGPLADDIQKQITLLPRNITAKLMGFVKNSEILKFYRENYVDLFINVSEIEGVPVSIMEALSFGIPVFATDVGGSCEVVNAEDGYCASSNFNLAELSNFIVNIRQASKEKNLRQNAYKVWSEKSNAEKNYKQLADILVK